MRRLAAKDGKNVTAGNVSAGNRSGLSEVTASTAKTYSHTTFQRGADPPSQLSPSLSSFRRPLTPTKVEPLPQAMPIPAHGGQDKEESDDSSSDKYSTPPTTAEHLVTTTTTGGSGGHTPQDTPTSVTPVSDVSEHDPVLEEFRRRRLQLKQQREQSGKKSDASDSPPTTSETKRETETLPPLVGPTQLSTQASSSQYSGGGTEPHQTYTSNVNPSLSTGIYCPHCHCKVELGHKYCSYCGESVSMLFTKKPSAGSSAAGPAISGSEGVDMSVPYGSSAHPQPGSGQSIRPDPNAPTLPPKPRPRFPSKVAAAAEQSFLYDPSGHPKRASVPPEKEGVLQPPPPQQPSSSYHQHCHQPARQPQQKYQEPVSSQAASAVGGRVASAGAGASGYSPVGAGILQYSEKLRKFRNFLQQKGKSDAEIDQYPDYLMMMEEERRKQPNQGSPSYDSAPGYANAPASSAEVDRYGGQPSGVSSQSKEKPDMSKYKKVYLLESDYSSENQRAMEKLKNDGQQLLNWIKVNSFIGVKLYVRVWCSAQWFGIRTV